MKKKHYRLLQGTTGVAEKLFSKKQMKTQSKTKKQHLQQVKTPPTAIGAF
jgi:hypothetical protein